jgi:ATP phosphoribosyltransferase
MNANEPLILAVPKGRILKEVGPMMARAGVEPEADFYNESSRRLQFNTSDPGLGIIRVRSFDTATFLAFGAAHLAICGSDVLMEFDHPEIYSPVDLRVGRCRLSVAEPAELAANEDPRRWSHLRVATKYPNVTKQYFAARGVQAECIKLSGAMELAPRLGLCRRIVDLVQTGSTLKANGLVEVEKIAEVSSRLAVNRAALKTQPNAVNMWVDRFREAAIAA